MSNSFAGKSRIWIFDLDNTLHDARPHIFPHINRSMTDYVSGLLDLGEADANALRMPTGSVTAPR
jgi:putative hydrolase of the HAD superfamily